MNKQFAIVTGASSGIGLELGAICAQEGFDLLIGADRPEIEEAADRFRDHGADVTVVEPIWRRPRARMDYGPPRKAAPLMRCWPTRGMASDMVDILGEQHRKMAEPGSGRKDKR